MPIRKVALLPRAPPSRTMVCMRKHRIIAGAAIMTSLTAILAGTAFASSAPPGALPPLNPATLRTAMAGLPNSTVTSELVKISGPAGTWNGTSGVSDLQTKAPVDVNGNFDVGDAIDVVCGDEQIGKGISNYSADELLRVRGLKSAEVRALLPLANDEAVHRDYFVLA